jgi:hypothetical protein
MASTTTALPPVTAPTRSPILLMAGHCNALAQMLGYVDTNFCGMTQVDFNLYLDPDYFLLIAYNLKGRQDIISRYKVTV